MTIQPQHCTALVSGIIAHHKHTQVQVHRHYGGIVPELACRAHATHLLTLVHRTLSSGKPTAVACTAGPGLAGCLATGISLAQALAFAWQVPLAPVHHLEAHLLSPFLERATGFDFPYLALLASGGHTALVAVAARHSYATLSTTLDDAAGEAFDKTGTLLGLEFPGGPQLEQLARNGDPDKCPLPIAMQKRTDLAMSFSGLKAAARRLVREGQQPADIAAAFQVAAIRTITSKTNLALQQTGYKRLAVVGGVACNAALRHALDECATAHGARLYNPPMQWCTDNAAMIAYAGATRLQDDYKVQVRPRWPLAELI